MSRAPTKLKEPVTDSSDDAVTLVQRLFDHLGIPVVELEGEARHTWGQLAGHSSKTVWVNAAKLDPYAWPNLAVEVMRLDAQVDGGVEAVGRVLRCSATQVGNMGVHPDHKSVDHLLHDVKVSASMDPMMRAGIVAYADPKSGWVYTYPVCSLIRAVNDSLRNSELHRGYALVRGGPMCGPHTRPDALYALVRPPVGRWRRQGLGGAPWAFDGRGDIDTALSILESALLPPLSLF